MGSIRVRSGDYAGQKSVREMPSQAVERLAVCGQTLFYWNESLEFPERKNNTMGHIISKTYCRTKTDGLRYVESRSSDKIDSQIGTLPSKFPHHIRVRTLTCDRFNVYQPFYHVRLTT
ncbi:hypothetical protein TNCV_674311 [Trichonephila clavipes]|nr:hypothetical protein TNCV_674311 [Trichonephila clavipes]